MADTIRNGMIIEKVEMGCFFKNYCHDGLWESHLVLNRRSILPDKKK